MNSNHNELDLISIRRRVAQRSTWVNVLANLFLSILQVIIGVLASSAALVADAMHTLSDIVTDIVVLVANKFSGQPSDETHPYGHFRFENLATLIIGLILFAVGLGMIYNGADRLFGSALFTPVHYAALITAAVVLVAKEVLFRYLLREGERVNSLMLVANAWHARSDALSSLVVLLAVGANLFGIHWADIVAFLLIGGMIAKMGFMNIYQSLRDLSDHAANDEKIQAIKEILDHYPDILGYHDLRTRMAGDFILVDVHLEFEASTTVAHAHDVSEDLCRQIKSVGHILEIVTHFDPREAPKPIT